MPNLWIKLYNACLCVGKTEDTSGLVQPKVSGIHRQSWNVSPVDMGATAFVWIFKSLICVETARIHSPADYISFKTARVGEVRPPWRGCRAKGRKSMPVSPGPFSCKHAHAHTPEHIHIHPEHKNSKLKWLFQPTLNFISVCFLVTWSDSKPFSLVFPFLKENIP